MQATVQVTGDVARAIRARQTSTWEAKGLLGLLNEWGVTVTPLHSDTADPELQTYFVMDLPDDGSAEEILGHLRDMAGVEAAYVKPPDDLP